MLFAFVLSVFCNLHSLFKFNERLLKSREAETGEDLMHSAASHSLDHLFISPSFEEWLVNVLHLIQLSSSFQIL